MAARFRPCARSASIAPRASIRDRTHTFEPCRSLMKCWIMSPVLTLLPAAPASQAWGAANVGQGPPTAVRAHHRDGCCAGRGSFLQLAVLVCVQLMIFDATLGFPGEGPTRALPNHRPYQGISSSHTLVHTWPVLCTVFHCAVSGSSRARLASSR